MAGISLSDKVGGPDIRSREYVANAWATERISNITPTENLISSK